MKIKKREMEIEKEKRIEGKEGEYIKRGMEREIRRG